VSGHGRTDQLLSPIRIIVWMPEPENLKVEDLSKSVKQASHSEQATGHGMHCREIVFTPRCSPRAKIPKADCFLRYHFSAATRNFASGKSDVYIDLLAAAARSAFNMVLFTEPVSRRNTFVGGKCAPPSALLV